MTAELEAENARLTRACADEIDANASLQALLAAAGAMTRPEVWACTHPARSIRTVWEATGPHDLSTLECLKCMLVWVEPWRLF